MFYFVTGQMITSHIINFRRSTDHVVYESAESVIKMRSKKELHAVRSNRDCRKQTSERAFVT